MPTRGAPETNLTRRQLFIWLDHQLEPTLRANDTFALVRMAADVDVERFGRAFASVVRRSDALRTTFEDVGGYPRQRSHPGSISSWRRSISRARAIRKRACPIGSSSVVVRRGGSVSAHSTRRS